ncbi:hypothetical protein, partial [Bacteroides thetaiotaomicron]|uniref:hypothetical protein n=1 Tax=Bacteroides thetaiotaomicron TaxID=818 RepID=UPI0039C39D96
SDVKVWGRNITHGLYDQGNIGLIPHFDVETLCKYITIKNYTMEIISLSSASWRETGNHPTVLIF